MGLAVQQSDGRARVKTTEEKVQHIPLCLRLATSHRRSGCRFRPLSVPLSAYSLHRRHRHRLLMFVTRLTMGFLKSSEEIHLLDTLCFQVKGVRLDW